MYEIIEKMRGKYMKNRAVFSLIISLVGYIGVVESSGNTMPLAAKSLIFAGAALSVTSVGVAIKGLSADRKKCLQGFAAGLAATTASFVAGSLMFQKEHDMRFLLPFLITGIGASVGGVVYSDFGAKPFVAGFACGAWLPLGLIHGVFCGALYMV
jgi:hypothetical protein